MFSIIYKAIQTVSVLMFIVPLSACSSYKDISKDLDVTTDPIIIEHGSLIVEFDNLLKSRVVVDSNVGVIELSDFRETEYLELSDGRRISEFVLEEIQELKVTDSLGDARLMVLKGISAYGISKEVSVYQYDSFPDSMVFNVRYTNENSEQPLKITKWVNHNYNVKKSEIQTEGADDFWAYEGATYDDRRDWIKPLAIGYQQENYMGMNASDYGGGTAIVDIWRQDVGLAIGHIETSPKLVAIPVSYNNAAVGAEMRIELELTHVLARGESTETLNTFVGVHHGDYYATLKNYRSIMAVQGLVIDKAPEASYESIWCAWGYERDFDVNDILATLPKAKELGLKWAVLDDGWQTAEGDWYLHPDRFPNGSESMKDFVQKINQEGLKAKLWWAPLAVDPGTDLIRNHSDMLLLDKDGKTQDITWWDSYYLCPAYEPTREHTKTLVKTIMEEWGYEGLKIDGHHLNGVAECHNPKHNHDSPRDSVEQLAEYWKLVYDTAMEINPNAVVEICPCGTNYAFHNLPFMNQTVSSDPLSSWQVRLKGKTLKGLMGDDSPYYGDHVELADNASDFASSFGIGGILGTKFTVGVTEGPGVKFLLNEEREKSWAKWIGLYNETMLSSGMYLGELYDLGFDKPETHAVQKNGILHYAFYAPSWNADVELRGLVEGVYEVEDYFNGKVLGRVSVANGQSSATLNVRFDEYLLLRLNPVTSVALRS